MFLSVTNNCGCFPKSAVTGRQEEVELNGYEWKGVSKDAG